MKTALIKWLLALVALLGVAAQLISPLGDALERQHFLGGSFGAVVAFILFDAISGGADREVSGVEVFDTLRELSGPAEEAFEARHVRIDFAGFTMETFYGTIRDPLLEVADGSLSPKRITLRIIVAHLNSPMNLPGELASLRPGRDVAVFTDSAVNRERMRNDYTLKYWEDLRTLLDRAQRRNPKLVITCEVRESPHGPQSKLYIFDEDRAVYTTYGIRKSRFERNGRECDILDAEGLGIRHGEARYLSWSRRSRTKTTRQIANYHMEWFQNLWDVLEDVKPAVPVIPNPVWEPSA
ncbi:hypothetical protein [Streptomyces huasconensis]|uniref:hypothetical protein n=1 Tax=Streptomyces huasconensis TaxID=1854574 RepID=UPI0036F8F88D